MRPDAANAPGMFTVGYQQLSVEQLLRKLHENGIETVVDVRDVPFSRRPGFSKGALASALGKAGIAYVHERELGNPPENRERFRRGEIEEGRAVMLERLTSGSSVALERLMERARNERVAVLCLEALDRNCHRQLIVDEVRRRDPAIVVKSIW